MNNGLYGVITGPPPVNDHTCTRCGNKKCSKTEKSCWSCGEAIPKEDHSEAIPKEGHRYPKLSVSGYNRISLVPTIVFYRKFTVEY